MSASIAPSPAPLTSEATRDAQLAAITERVRTLGFGMARVMTRLTGERLTGAEFQHYAMVAVWEAYVALSEGDPTFDIPTHAEELEKAALKQLRADLSGKDTVFGDVALRARHRKNRSMVDSYAWTAWRYNALEHYGDRGGPQRESVVTEYIEHLEQDVRLVERQLLELEGELRAVLSPREFKWLTERECRGVPQADQIAELLAEDARSDSPRYQGPDGAKRAENVINVAIHRAKKKAAQRLGPSWEALSREIAA